uniref:ABC transporter ATP-binding protein n=1 Tax=Desulfomonile tiedjei TaxID=2358 RepID=A0A7C4AR79_9BACT
MTLLKVSDVDVHYGPVRILTHVSLEINEGEIVSLLGGNGAGKTTTVRTIAGLVWPSSGKITFHDKDISRWPAYRRVEEGLVMVPEGRKTFPTLSVLENLEMGSFLKKSKARRTESLDRVMQMFPILAERSSQPAGTLSGGQQQMLAIGRGLMSLPTMLIFDEPSLGLAPIIVNEIFAAIREANKAGVTVLLVEQNVHRALAMSHRAYVLEEGTVALSGAADELSKDDYIRRLYLGLE